MMMADIVRVASVVVFIFGGCSRVLSSIDCFSYCTNEVGQSFSCDLTLIRTLDLTLLEFRLRNKCGPSQPTNKKCNQYKDGNDSILQANWKAPDDASIKDLTGFKVDVVIPNKLEDHYIINSTTSISQDIRFKYRIECHYADKGYKTPVFISIYSLPRNGVGGCSNQRIECSWEVTNGNFGQNIISPTFPATSMATTTAILTEPSDSNSPLTVIVVPVAVILSVGLAVLTYLIRKKVFCRPKNPRDDNERRMTNNVEHREQHVYGQSGLNGHVHNCPVHGQLSSQFISNRIQDPHLQRNEDQTLPRPSSTEASGLYRGLYQGSRTCRRPSVSSDVSQEDNQCISIESQMLEINGMLGTV